MATTTDSPTTCSGRSSTTSRYRCSTRRGSAQSPSGRPTRRAAPLSTPSPHRLHTHFNLSSHPPPHPVHTMFKPLFTPLFAHLFGPSSYPLSHHGHSSPHTLSYTMFTPPGGQPRLLRRRALVAADGDRHGLGAGAALSQHSHFSQDYQPTLARGRARALPTQSNPSLRPCAGLPPDARSKVPSRSGALALDRLVPPHALRHPRDVSATSCIRHVSSSCIRDVPPSCIRGHRSRSVGSSTRSS